MTKSDYKKRRQAVPIQVTPPTPTWRENIIEAARIDGGLKPPQWIYHTLTNRMREIGVIQTPAETI